MKKESTKESEREKQIANLESQVSQTVFGTTLEDYLKATETKVT